MRERWAGRVWAASWARVSGRARTVGDGLRPEIAFAGRTRGPRVAARRVRRNVEEEQRLAPRRQRQRHPAVAVGVAAAAALGRELSPRAHDRRELRLRAAAAEEAGARRGERDHHHLVLHPRVEEVRLRLTLGVERVEPARLDAERDVVAEDAGPPAGSVAAHRRRQLQRVGRRGGVAPGQLQPDRPPIEVLAARVAAPQRRVRGAASAAAASIAAREAGAPQRRTRARSLPVPSGITAIGTRTSSGTSSTSRVHRRGHAPSARRAMCRRRRRRGSAARARRQTGAARAPAASRTCARARGRRPAPVPGVRSSSRSAAFAAAPCCPPDRPLMKASSGTRAPSSTSRAVRGGAVDGHADLPLRAAPSRWRRRCWPGSTVAPAAPAAAPPPTVPRLDLRGDGATTPPTRSAGAIVGGGGDERRRSDVALVASACRTPYVRAAIEREAELAVELAPRADHRATRARRGGVPLRRRDAARRTSQPACSRRVAAIRRIARCCR